jgi:hypothetical protein
MLPMASPRNRGIMIDEKQAINRIGFRMVMWMVITAVLLVWLQAITGNSIFTVIEVIMQCGNIAGNMIYMYVVAKSYED